MDKEFVQSSNYFVADSMNGEPTVTIDNFYDTNDGGFKFQTTVDFDTHIVVVENTIARSLKENGEEHESPDYRIIEINKIDKKIKAYKVKLYNERELTKEEIEAYCVNSEATTGEA